MSSFTSIPYTDHECRLKLNELLCGECAVVPTSEEHARFIIEVAQNYIKQKQNETWGKLQGKT